MWPLTSCHATSRSVLCLGGIVLTRPWPCRVGENSLTYDAGNYAAGGVIPGNSPTGDRLQANVNSGAMILNQRQQAELFKRSNEAGGGGLVVNVQNYGNDTVETQKNDDGSLEVIIRAAADLAKSELADEVNSGGGEFSPMLQNTFGLSRGYA